MIIKNMIKNLTKKIQNLLKRLMAKSITLSNVAEGIHSEGRVTYTAAAAIASKYLFGKLTSNVGEIAVSGAGNTSTGARAIGVITDEADAAADPVSVSLIGATGSTLKVLAGGTIAAGDLITADANSKAVTVASQPTSATYYVYGIALIAGASGDVVEFVPTPGVTLTK